MPAARPLTTFAFEIADYLMKRPLMIAACLALTAAAFAAAAQNAPAPAATPPTPAAAATPTVTAGDAAKGRLLIYTCQGCHGIAGYKNAYPNYHVPMIGGQSAAYLTNALTEYKQGRRKHPTMQAQAESISDQDIADIVAFLSNVK